MTTVRIRTDMAGTDPDQAHASETARWETFGHVTGWRIFDDHIVLDVHVASNGARIALEAAVRERPGSTVVHSVTGA